MMRSSICEQSAEISDMLGAPATNARRTSRPSSVRMGMFCRFGSLDESRPVAATVWLNEVCTRPVSGWTSRGSASTYVDFSLATAR